MPERGQLGPVRGPHVPELGPGRVPAGPALLGPGLPGPEPVHAPGPGLGLEPGLEPGLELGPGPGLVLGPGLPEPGPQLCVAEMHTSVVAAG